MHIVRDPEKRILSRSEIADRRMGMRIDQARDDRSSPRIDGPIDRSRQSATEVFEDTIRNQDRIRIADGVIHDARYKSANISDKSGNHNGRLYKTRRQL